MISHNNSSLPGPGLLLRREGIEVRPEPSAPGTIMPRHMQNRPWPSINSAFTLIEMVGVLAVIAILALILIPVLIRQMDRVALDKETKLLKTFADGLRQQIINTRYIPDHTTHPTWYSMIASNLGLSTNQVLINDRRVARVFLIDPTFELRRFGESASKPPYRQNANGAMDNPNSPPFRNPRLMILSSIAQPLPVASGVSTAFNTIWNTEEGKVPADSAWNSFQKGEDLRIQRVHLGDLFVDLSLNLLDSSSPAYPYAIHGEFGTQLFVDPRYFLDSSLLELYDGCSSTNVTLRYSEILHRSKSFSFVGCSWQQGDDSVTRRLDRPRPLDLQLASNEFLSLTNFNPWRDGWPSQNSTNKIHTTNVISAMTNYMRRYIDWRLAQPNAASGDQPLRDAQTELNNSTLWMIDPNGTPVP